MSRYIILFGLLCWVNVITTSDHRNTKESLHAIAIQGLALTFWLASCSGYTVATVLYGCGCEKAADVVGDCGDACVDYAYQYQKKAEHSNIQRMK